MKRFLIAALLLPALATQAQDDAQSGGQWRIGLGPTFGNYETDDNLVDDSTIGFQLSATYLFNDWFGVEGAYLNTSDFETTVRPGTFGNVPAGGTVQDSLSGFSIGGTILLPFSIEDISLLVKAGFFDFDLDRVVTGAGTSSGAADGGYVGGAGVIEITESWAIRGDLVYYDADGAELWNVVLGAEYRF